MLMTKTTELGLQSVLYMAQQPEGHRVNPQEVAERLEESPSYLAKVFRQLALAGIIRAHRGASGGFELARAPSDITLLDVVEACQGAVRGNYCAEVPPERVPLMCGWHQAMWELKESCRAVLSRWTIARILERPVAKVPSPACRYRRLRIKFEPVPREI
ncbi:MAG: Rrf2 family transcriptional regulator [Kiritimatiellae bacterium]|nr:Rrf2 family transcriptional regulator [Kiritimatiellia bacterium]MDW8458321.1 Rrf2 family transcriptional regulator [Verrucomicrobiota bacterium]